MTDLSINTELATKILSDFINSEIIRTGYKKAVLGISGGLDSALVCVLAARALGPKNVLAIRMPYRTSSQDSLDDADKIIELSGVESLTFPITAMADALIESTPDMDTTRKGNIMARMRMIVLYDQSAAFGGLVVGTGNKTEILLGYTTLYGDSACALNPLGDLYKTQVRQLANELSIPPAIVNKPPSADLWAGQTDEGDLGFTYAEVDQLLYLLVDERYSPQECIAAGFKEEFVKEVMRRVQRNHFKRVMPPICKLNNRTIGYDFLYMRDWGT